MSTEFFDVDLMKIEEGQFLEDSNDALVSAQMTLLAHLERHGERAKGAKATVTMSITMSVEDVLDSTFGIESKIKIAAPQRPAKKTMAICDRETRRLQCRAEGKKALVMFGNVHEEPWKHLD